MTLYCELTIVGPMQLVTVNPGGAEIDRRRGLGSWYLIPEDAIEALDKITDPFGVSGNSWISRAGDGVYHPDDYPWVLIALDREYRLVGHLKSVKGDTADLRFSCYSMAKNRIDPADVRHVSFLIAMNKEILASLHDCSPMLAAAWALLQDKPENKRWFCICDPLPQQWAAEHEAVDEQLLQMLRQTGVVPEIANPRK